MKRKIQPNAVNNQEDEDSSGLRVYFPSDAAVKKTEDKSAEESSGQIVSEAQSNKDELISNRE